MMRPNIFYDVSYDEPKVSYDVSYGCFPICPLMHPKVLCCIPKCPMISLNVSYHVSQGVIWCVPRCHMVCPKVPYGVSQGVLFPNMFYDVSQHVL